jgi:hypothetical protein
MNEFKIEDYDSSLQLHNEEEWPSLSLPCSPAPEKCFKVFASSLNEVPPKQAKRKTSPTANDYAVELKPWPQILFSSPFGEPNTKSPAQEESENPESENPESEQPESENPESENPESEQPESEQPESEHPESTPNPKTEDSYNDEEDMKYFTTLTHDALDDAVSQQYLGGKTLTTTMVARSASLLKALSQTLKEHPDVVVETLLIGQDGCPEEAHLPLARETIKMLHGCLSFRFRDFSRWPVVFDCAEAIFSCFATRLVCAIKPPPLSLSCENVFSEPAVWRGGRGSYPVFLWVEKIVNQTELLDMEPARFLQICLGGAAVALDTSTEAEPELARLFDCLPYKADINNI